MQGTNHQRDRSDCYISTYFGNGHRRNSLVVMESDVDFILAFDAKILERVEKGIIDIKAKDRILEVVEKLVQ